MNMGLNYPKTRWRIIRGTAHPAAGIHLGSYLLQTWTYGRIQHYPSVRDQIPASMMGMSLFDSMVMDKR